MRLIDRLMRRADQIRDKVDGLLGRADLAAPGTSERARQIIGAVFAGDGLPLPQASWIAGLPLPLQLCARRPLTVDIAPEFLGNMSGAYGLDWTAIRRLAEHGVIRLNLRNFDPESADPEHELLRYSGHFDGLSELMKSVPGSVYFLGSLRPVLFGDQAGGTERLRSAFAETTILAPLAEKVAERIGADQAFGETSFRGEPFAFIQARWHWAYLKAMEDRIPAETRQVLNGEFQHLAATDPGDDEAQTGFARFVRRLRLLHLVHAAPLTAAFGGEYCMKLVDEYDDTLSVARQGNGADSGSILTPAELVATLFRGDLPDSVGGSAAAAPPATFASVAMRLFSIAAQSKHSADETLVDGLLAYFADAPARQPIYADFDRALDAALSGSVDFERLGDLAEQHAKICAVDAADLANATGGRLSTTLLSARMYERGGQQMLEVNPKAVSLLINYLSGADNIKPRFAKIMPGMAGDHRRRLLQMIDATGGRIAA